MPKKFIRSFKYAKDGAEHALKTQRNIWIHFFIGLAVLALGVGLKVSFVELAILVLTVFIVIAVELLNTAVEELVNILSPERRIEAALAKNVAAAAVLLASAGAFVVGLLIFLPRVF